MNFWSKERFTVQFWEWLLQFIFIVVVFIFYAFGRRDNVLEEHEIVFFLNYALAAFVMNYWIIPKFLYAKKYLFFVLSTLAVITLVILIEEGVLEQIYFPDTRGKRFPGIYDSLLSILPILTIFAAFKLGWDAFQKERKLEEMQRLVQDSELQFLKSQINPHFLFNNLNNLYAHALENSDKTPTMILELSGVLRYMLYECKETFVPLDKELAQLTNFINLSRLQFEGRGEVKFEVSNNAADKLVIAPLILTVFIENAFKHSSSSISEDILIDVRVQINKDGVLHFKCSNSYSAQTNTEDLSHGIGLDNVVKRLEILYPNQHELQIEQQKDMFLVNLSINLTGL